MYSETASKFEVASVHPTARPDATEADGGLIRGGLYVVRRATMLDLVRTAYDADARKVLGGPNWLELDRFDIKAKLPPGTTTAGVKPMLQALLADRFGLVAHRDTKPVQAWALTVGNHPVLKRSGDSGEGGCRSNESDDLVNLTCRNVTMAAFVSYLRRGDDGVWYYLTDNLVVDQTELEGAWDFDLKYSARWKTTVAGTGIISLFDAIDKIGLKLGPSMVRMPVVVVDRVNRAPTPDSPQAEQAFPPSPTHFEVADVKPTDPVYQGPDSFELPGGGRVNVRAETLKSLVADAWGVTEEMIVNAPKFTDSDRWDIVAKAPDVAVADGDDDLDAVFVMVKTLLADRFGLAVHFEDRPMPAPVMIAPRPRLKKADPDSRTGCREGLPTLVKVDPRSTNPTTARLVTCTNVSMNYLASHLRLLASGYVHSDVQDATGLEGGWDFTLSFSKVRQLRGNEVSPPGASEASDPNGALSVQDAMERQLGLKLMMRKRPVRVLVIDHIEEKPTGN